MCFGYMIKITGGLGFYTLLFKTDVVVHLLSTHITCCDAQQPASTLICMLLN